MVDFKPFITFFPASARKLIVTDMCVCLQVSQMYSHKYEKCYTNPT